MQPQTPQCDRSSSVVDEQPKISGIIKSMHAPKDYSRLAVIGESLSSSGKLESKRQSCGGCSGIGIKSMRIAQTKKSKVIWHRDTS